MKGRKRKGLVGNVRSIADILEQRNFHRFPAYLREAAKEISELRWENGVLRRKLNMKKAKAGQLSRTNAKEALTHGRR